MFKKILATLAMLVAVTAFAAVDANKGSAADLDALKGVGPALSKRIVDAREQSQFKDWNDLMSRVKGVKNKFATKLSAEGMTVNGQSFSGAAPAAKVAKADSTKATPAKADASAPKPAVKP